jgi:hypothetical protein
MAARARRCGTPVSKTSGRRAGIGAGILVGGIIVLNLLAQGLDRAVGGNEPGGVSNSSYATAPAGAAAYSALLTHYGRRVTHQRGDLSPSRLAPVDTVILLEPDVVTAEDATVLLEFVTNGGRLVVGDEDPLYLHDLRDRPPLWDGGRIAPWNHIDAALGNVRSIAAVGGGQWTDTGSGTPVVGDNVSALVTSERVGRGEMLFLADPTPLQNAFLGAADNAAFALALSGPGHRVAFAEGVHGFGASRGISAIPTRWKYAIAMIGLGALAFVWSRARRFGPPDRATRELPPARSEYVRALSQTLERTRDRAHALAPVQQWTRDRLTARAALRMGATDEEISQAAKALGCTDHEVDALLAPVMNDDDALALGRVLARVTGGDGGIG